MNRFFGAIKPSKLRLKKCSLGIPYGAFGDDSKGPRKSGQLWQTGKLIEISGESANQSLPEIILLNRRKYYLQTDPAKSLHIFEYQWPDPHSGRRCIRGLQTIPALFNNI